MEDRGALAAATVEVQNHLFTFEAAHHSSSLRRKNQEESVEPNLKVLKNTVNSQMEKLYKKRLPNLKYNKHLPVFIDPGNPKKYIPLTVGVIQAWAQALHLGINHFSLYSPPSSIKFVRLNSKKLKTDHPSGSNDMTQLLVRLLGQKNEGSSPKQSDSNQSSTKIQEESKEYVLTL
ncbi:uncharacterized protein VP01_9434g1 [Puccinia sorghi]|uniref:Uncharacterized protein n=1 Tax=Puccinia sorghi TaxID=27349 RepID=A0A0L6U8Q3_9BASI|nr:uncharacterized protein VP01_9434g1 [Puccinia sorghi]